MKRKTVEEVRTEQEARRQDKTDRLEKLQAAQIKLYEAKIKLKEVESLPVSHDEAKVLLLAQIDEAAAVGKRALASKLESHGNLTLADLQQDSREIQAYIQRDDLVIAVNALLSGNRGLSQMEKASRISAARLAVQLLENEVKQFA